MCVYINMFLTFHSYYGNTVIAWMSLYIWNKRMGSDQNTKYFIKIQSIKNSHTLQTLGPSLSHLVKQVIHIILAAILVFPIEIRDFMLQDICMCILTIPPFIISSNWKHPNHLRRDDFRKKLSIYIRERELVVHTRIMGVEFIGKSYINNRI